MEPQQKINKPVSTLAIIPKTGSITRLGRQAYAVMLMSAGKQVTEDPKTGMFVAPLQDIIRGFEGNVESASEIQRTLRLMVSSVVEWQSPTDGESYEWNACGLLSAVKIKKQKGENYVYWAYAPNIRDELLNPQRYAQLRRSTIAKASSHASLALYENCVRYKDVPSGLTSEHSWEWWIPVLRGKPVKPGIKIEYGAFKRDTLKAAIIEVNEISEILIKLIEKKAGKAISRIQFEVRKKPNVSQELDEAGPVDASSLVKAEKMGIPVKIADEHFGRYGNKAFLDALNKFAIRSKQYTSPIKNKLAYLKSILENGAAEAALDIEYKAEEPKQEVSQPKPTYKHPVADKQDQLKESDAKRIDVVKKEIHAMSAGELTDLLAELNSNIPNELKTTRIIARIDAGEWDSPIVFSFLARFYWKKTRGTDWFGS